MSQFGYMAFLGRGDVSTVNNLQPCVHVHSAHLQGLAGVCLTWLYLSIYPAFIPACGTATAWVL